MKIFKLFYLLLRDNLTTILFNSALLLAIVIPINAIYNNTYSSQFEVNKVDIGLIHYDEGNPVSENLIHYLEQHSNVIPIDDAPEVVADTLYYQNADYILTIPEGFGESIVNPAQEDVLLEKNVTQAPEEEAFADILINSYLTNLQLQLSQLTDVEDVEQLNRTLASFSEQMEQANVEIIPPDSSTNVSLLAFGTNYIYFISYIMLSVFITTFGYAVLAMKNPEIVKRDRMGMITERNRWAQSLLGCISFGLVYWMVLIAIAAILYGADTVLSQKGLLLTLNSLAAMFGIQAMAYFCVTIANSKGAISFLSTIVSLTIAFSSGIFIPRQFVSPVMQQIASFAVPIWQVKGSEIIMDSTSLAFADIQPFYQMLGIQLLIGTAYYSISFVIQKYRRERSIY